MEIVSMWICRLGRCKRGDGSRGGLPRTKLAIRTVILVVTGKQGKSITGKHALTSLASSQMIIMLTNHLPTHFFPIVLYLFFPSFTLLSSHKAPYSLISLLFFLYHYFFKYTEKGLPCLPFRAVREATWNTWDNVEDGVIT